MTNSEWAQFPWRTDILDADLDAIYEIKPVRSADAGPPQLARYQQQLQLCAPKTPDGTRNRNWQGGGAGDPWDPRPYTLVMGSGSGRICAICPWLDPDTKGLILYDIVCCTIGDELNAAAYLTATKLAQLPTELQSFQPTIQKWIGDQLPLAPTGSMYVVLMPRRFYEAFVLIPRAMKSGHVRQVDRLLEASYGPQPGPVLTALVVETWVAGHFLAGPAADIPMWASGWITTDELIRLYERQALAGLTGAAAVAVVAVAVAATDGAALAALPEAAEVPEVLEVAEELEAIETVTAPPETPVGWPGEPVPEPAGPSLFQDGVGAGEALEVGRSLPPWVINPPTAGAGPTVNAGLGMIGAFLIGAVTPDAQAGTGGAAPAGTALIGADRVFLVPAELVTPATGTLAVDQKVDFGGGTYYVGGFVTASPAGGP
ncbi:MAG TPA: hypothetical protein VGS19_25980 [Streptosporangiaceae bacterium]|nr:hypothetical protein [Streptosporangiaceae bacterium]